MRRKSEAALGVLGSEVRRKSEAALLAMRNDGQTQDGDVDIADINGDANQDGDAEDNGNNEEVEQNDANNVDTNVNNDFDATKQRRLSRRLSRRMSRYRVSIEDEEPDVLMIPHGITQVENDHDGKRGSQTQSHTDFSMTSPSNYTTSPSPRASTNQLQASTTIPAPGSGSPTKSSSRLQRFRNRHGSNGSLNLTANGSPRVSRSLSRSFRVSAGAGSQSNGPTSSAATGSKRTSSSRKKNRRSRESGSGRHSDRQSQKLLKAEASLKLSSAYGPSPRASRRGSASSTVGFCCSSQSPSASPSRRGSATGSVTIQRVSHLDSVDPRATNALGPMSYNRNSASGVDDVDVRGSVQNSVALNPSQSMTIPPLQLNFEDREGQIQDNSDTDSDDETKSPDNRNSESQMLKRETDQIANPDSSPSGNDDYFDSAAKLQVFEKQHRRTTRRSVVFRATESVAITPNMVAHSPSLT